MNTFTGRGGKVGESSEPTSYGHTLYTVVNNCSSLTELSGLRGNIQNGRVESKEYAVSLNVIAHFGKE